MSDRPRDRLSGPLRDLADTVVPADLYDGAIRRSRRIARREATVGTVAALAALALLASGLWQMPGDRSGEPPRAIRAPAVAPPATHESSPAPPPTHAPAATTPAAEASAAAHKKHKNQPRVIESTAPPQSRKLADLRGQIFYQRAGADPDVVRLSPSGGGTRTVLPDAPSRVGISPDGNRIAYAVGNDLLIADTAGGPASRVATGVSTADQAPTWSPDGGRLLVHTSRPTVLALGSGTLSPLPLDLGSGLHFRWSGDGTKLIFATAYCGLEVTGSSGGGSGLSVPVLGDRRPVDNPDGLAACKPTSVDVAGDRVTVPLQTTGETGADSPDTADAVVDTATGDVMPLPVSGSVVGAVFDPDGNLLVRSRTDDTTRLSLFTPGGTLQVQAIEPAALRDLDLLAYTR